MRHNTDEPVLSPVDEQAKRAVKVFQKLQPTLTSYARVLTGNPKVRVQLSASSDGSTDGKAIFYRPPISLGNDLPHERRICGKRDNSGLMVCLACRNREEVLVTIYHEIAHIAFKTFDRTRRTELSLLRHENKFFPLLYNALEDARVNKSLFEARTGTRLMFKADEERIFSKGVERNVNGVRKTSTWRDMPLNHQVIIGTYCKAIGYDYTRWFDSRVVEALGDEALTSLLATITLESNSESIFQLSHKVLSRLEALGFCGGKWPTKSGESSESQRSPDSNSISAGNQSSQADSSSSSASESESNEGNSSAGEDGRSDSQDNSGDSPVSPEGSPSDGLAQGASQPDNSNDRVDRGRDSTQPQGEEVLGDSGGNTSEFDPSAQDSRGLEDEEAGAPDSHPLSGVAGESGESDQLGQSSSGSNLSDDEGEEEAGSSASGSSSGLEEGEAEGNSDGLDTSSGRSDADSHDSLRSETGRSKGDPSAAPSDFRPTLIKDHPSEEEMGNPAGLEALLEKAFGHQEEPTFKENAAMNIAVTVGVYFSSRSRTITSVREHRNGRGELWTGYDDPKRYMPQEQIIQPAVLRARRAFTDNQRGAQLRNRRSGRVNAAVLGKRAWSGDDRLFYKNILPGKKDYFFVIGMDISGSTGGINLKLEKRAIMAQATILERVGVPFAIYAHTGSRSSLIIYEVKSANESWSSKTQAKLARIKSGSANLDGHALEYLRKRADESSATDKVILYYSDGKMPMENYNEELEILRREIGICKKKNYTLLGVGIRTDSPEQHGLETVRVDEDGDLIKVVTQLGKRLSDTITYR